MKPKIAIDIGTSYTKIYKAKADVVLCEPTVIAIKNKNYKEPFACGQEALSLVGKTTEDIEIIFPVKNTEIVDFKALSALLKHFVKKVKNPCERMQDALLTVGCGSTREIIKKFENALISAKLFNACYAESPILSLIGAGVELSENSPVAVIDFGGGQTTVCVLTTTGVISGVSAEIGGNTLNKMIMEHAERELHLAISENTAETLKVSLSSLDEDDENKIVISGKDTLSGKTRSIQISAAEIFPPIKAFTDKVLSITNMIFSSLNDDTVLEIHKNGVYLTGGGSKIYGIADYVGSALGVKTTSAEEGEIAAIIGAGKLVESGELLEKLKLRV